MAEQGKKLSGEQEKKRPRFSEKAEGSGENRGAKKSSAVAVATVSPAELAVPSPTPTAPRRAPLSLPSPIAKAKPITPEGMTTPLAVMPQAPALPAPSPVATKTRALTELNAVSITKSAATVAVTSPVAAMPPALAAPNPAATRMLAAPSPMATETQTPVLVAIAKPAVVVKADGDVAGQAGGAAEEDDLVNVDLPKKRLHCAVCLAALRPPVFKCENEHAVCYACAGGGGMDKHCGPCSRAVTFTHSRYIDGLIGDYKVSCPYKKHGCVSSVVYHAAADHKARCAHAPCYCFECTPPFEGSSAELLRHLTAPSGKHSWLTEEISYETCHTFVVPASSQDHRWLLVAEDGCVFLLAVGAGRGPAGRRPVNVVCVRGNAGVDARPLYTGVLWVDGPPAAVGHLRGRVQVKGDVANCPVPSELDMEQGCLHAHVNPSMLHGESGEVHLRLRITKFP